MSYPRTDHIVEAALAAGPRVPTRVEVVVPRPWRAPPDPHILTVTYTVGGRPERPVLDATVGGNRFCLDDPVRLQPVTIAKPWGREIWYTGMEARGESAVLGDRGALGLGSYLGLAPERLCRRQPIVLLKVLDPLPVPVRGELYLEVHEKKQEVYVVTGVDPSACPDGRGRIRFGVNQALRRAYADDGAFREAFLQAVQRYEAVRRAVDNGDPGLQDEERDARSATLAFTAERALAVGDVVRVPVWVPHSLQPGVRVVEFQTPTYERFIISSSQKVLTQDGWDSAHAIARMNLDTPPDPPPEPVAPGVNRIVRFQEFSVWQARLSGGGEVIPPASLPYAVALCIAGAVDLPGNGTDLRLSEGQAALIPATALGRPVRAAGRANLLLAAPGL